MNGARIETLAMFAVAASGAAWGIYWIPLRALDAAGITGVWSIVLFYVLPALLLLPVFIMRRQALLQAGWSFQLAGILAGSALVLYAGALVFTDVVRALLFYYLTPLWSTLLARIVLGETITWQRWVTMAVALAGLLVILNVGSGFSVTLNAGDWMGLASGVVWAIA
ncbi:MAG: DMT family transporter, partial [Pseudomonadota bacterium]